MTICKDEDAAIEMPGVLRSAPVRGAGRSAIVWPDTSPASAYGEVRAISDSACFTRSGNLGQAEKFEYIPGAVQSARNCLICPNGDLDAKKIKRERMTPGIAAEVCKRCVRVENSS